jgi:hypothetical protein
MVAESGATVGGAGFEQATSSDSAPIRRILIGTTAVFQDVTDSSSG